jgi:hypothetical protein
MTILEKTVFSKDKQNRPKLVHSFFLGTDFFVGASISMTHRTPIAFELGIGVLHFTYVLTRCFYND